MVVLILRDDGGQIVDVRLFPSRSEAAAFLQKAFPSAPGRWEATERCPPERHCSCRYRQVSVTDIAPRAPVN